MGGASGSCPSSVRQNAVLRIPYTAVETARSKQLGMGTDLDNASVVKHKGFVHILQPHQPVGEEQEVPAAPQFEKSIQEIPFGERVKVCARFIKKENELGRQPG